MKIAIDARFYGEAGPGRYCAEIIKNLEELDQQNDYTVFLKSLAFDRYQPRNPRFQKSLADFHWYSAAEQIVFPLILYRGRFDLVHFTQVNVPLLFFGRFVVTIHDLILHEFSTERGGWLRRIIYRLKKVPYHLTFLKDVYLSSKIFVPSQATKDDLLKHYRVDPQKIVVTHEAADHYPSGKALPVEEVLASYGINQPYILCLGSFYPHKNVQRLLTAFKVLRTKSIFEGWLVLVGKDSHFAVVAREFAKENSITGVIFPSAQHPGGYLPDEEVEAILSQAFLYTQPALKEGFGIPPVEAMVFGVPVVVSDIPCLREMCGSAAVYFDPRDVDDLVEQMSRVIRDESLRKALRERGYQNVRRFAWRETAGETWSVYRQTLG